MKINLSKGFITLAGHENKFITPEGDENSSLLSVMKLILKKYFYSKG